MEMTHWKKLCNPDYLGAYAFQPGEEITVTINKVQREIVVGAEGKKEECTVVHFAESGIKPFILNATNAKMITKITGTPYIEGWAGKRIVLGVEKVKAFGDVVEAVRVKNKRPKAAQSGAAQSGPAPICTDCGKQIDPFGDKPPEWVAQYTKEKFGAVLCIECGKNRSEGSQKKTDNMIQAQSKTDKDNKINEAGDAAC